MEKEKDLLKITADLRDKYPDLDIQKVEMGQDGSASLYLRPNDKVLASMEKSSILRRNYLTRTDLDLLAEKKKPSQVAPHSLYKRSYELYWDADLYGSVINTLANFAMKGFENDVGDPNIQHFFDSWVIDTNFNEVLEWIYLDFFRMGMVRTYKVLGKYEPKISYISNVPGKKPTKVKGWLNNLETAAKKLKWSQSYMPIRYTVLNPLLVNIEGSLLFDQAKVTLEAPPELKKLFQKQAKDLTPEDKELIKLLPSEFKNAVKAGKPIELNPELVGKIDYRKQPYERYSRPRGVRAFDSFEYKSKLKEADISTLDGITNYILKITVGNDTFPVTDAAELDRVAQLFNTPSKSFDIVYNHTLSIEKIVSPEIEAVLGKDKYGQVMEDITGALAFPRQLIDGMGSLNAASAKLVVMSVVEEINYARRQVTNWIYREYRQIAEAMKFDMYPKVRWDDTILKDIILYMTIISQLVDRRMLSYRTALEELGFNYDNELKNMEVEFDQVMEGTFGIIGSPWQQAKQGLPFGAITTDGDGNIQKTQRAPKGTPSAGRPKGQPAKPKQQNTKPKPSTKPPQKTQQSITVADILTHLDDSTYDKVMETIEKKRKKLRDGE
jgi:hypothetical protein